MKSEYNQKINELSKRLNVDEDVCAKYLKDNSLDATDIIKAIKESNFSEESVKELFNYNHTELFNPFIFLVTDLKDSINNMHNIINHFKRYNLKREILTTYFGIAHLINIDKELLMNVLGTLLKRFDENTFNLITNNNIEEIDQLALYNNNLTNVMKFFTTVNKIDEMADLKEYIEKLVNVSYMRTFLKIAEANKEEQENLNYFELRLTSNTVNGERDLFFEDMELHDLVVFDKLVEWILNDFDSNYDNIIEILETYVYEKFGGEYWDDDCDTTEYEENNENKKPKALIKKENAQKAQPSINKRKIYVNLEKILKDKIIGQDTVIEKIIQRLKIADFGVSKEAGAKAVYLLVGPTGVGKTEAVKIIGNNFVDDEEKLIRVDMSEYKEYHAVSKLIGSPPGYIGYNEQKNTVFDKISENPNAIILLDEIEKAHPEVLDIFLHIFDEGKAKTNNIFFMTSNIGTLEATKKSIGFNNEGQSDFNETKFYRNELEKYLRLEFINRIDEIIVFNPLKREDIMKIIKEQLKNIEQKLQIKKQISINIELTDEALNFLLSKIAFDKYGAREVRRIIECYVLKEIIDLSINQDINNGTLLVNFNNENLEFNYKKAKVLKMTNN